MADTFITKLTEVSSVTNDDLMLVVDNPTSTPSNKKVTTENFVNSVATLLPNVSFSNTQSSTITGLNTLYGNTVYANNFTTSQDGTDIVFKQYDATEVARIHDGATNSLAESLITDSTVDMDNTALTGNEQEFGTNPKILKMDSTTLVQVGATVSGTGIPTGATVTHVANSTVFSISADVTSSGTNRTVTFTKGAWSMAGTAGKGGFGFRRPVYTVSNTGTTGDDQSLELTLQHSGAIIKVTGAAYDLDLILPAVPTGCEGFHLDIAITTAFSGTNNLEISTNGTSGDAIYMYMNSAGTSGVDVDGGDVITFTNDVPVGTLCRLTCIEGGSAEKWIAEILQPSGTAAATGTAVG